MNRDWHPWSPERRAWRMGYDIEHWRSQLLRLRFEMLIEGYREFSERLGVHPSTVETWERGAFPFRKHLDRLEKLGKEVAGWTRRDWAQPKEGEDE